MLAFDVFLFSAEPQTCAANSTAKQNFCVMHLPCLVGCSFCFDSFSLIAISLRSLSCRLFYSTVLLLTLLVPFFRCWLVPLLDLAHCMHMFMR